MSDKIEVNLDKVVFTPEDLAKLNLQIIELPHKYAVGIIKTINEVISRNAEDKVKEVTTVKQHNKE